MKQITVEQCENFIRSKFNKLPFPNSGIEINHFFKMADGAGLYEHGTYGSPMSNALSKLTTVEAIQDDEGNFLYHVFRMQ